MIYVLPVGQPAISNRDLFCGDTTSLDACPEEAASADFLRAMAGWLG